jgi:hypothetical protein
MMETLVLNGSIILEPISPYNFDALETIPPREQKIMAGLIFDKLLSAEKILGFFKRYEGYEKLAFHYIWEDLFWRVLEKKT